MSTQLRRYRFGVAVLVALVWLGSIAACGQTTSSGDSTEESSGGSESSKPLSVMKSVQDAFPAEIQERGVLRAGVIAPSPPQVIIEDGKLSGIDIEIYRAIGQMAGLKVEFTKLPFTSLTAALQAGKVDATGSLVPSPDRTNVANFVIVYRVPFGILVPDGNPEKVDTSTDLCNLTVATVEGSAPPQNLIEARQPACKQAGKPITVSDFSDQSSALLAVQTGKADAFIQGYSLTQYIAKTTNNGDAFDSTADRDGIKGSIYFADAYGVLKDKDQLTEAMRMALTELNKNGTIGAILKKYGIPEAGVSEITINELSEADK